MELIVLIRSDKICNRLIYLIAELESEDNTDFYFVVGSVFTLTTTCYEEVDFYNPENWKTIACKQISKGYYSKLLHEERDRQLYEQLHSV